MWGRGYIVDSCVYCLWSGPFCLVQGCLELSEALPKHIKIGIDNDFTLDIINHLLAIKFSRHPL